MSTRTSTFSTPVYRLWMAVLCGYLALGATLQVLPMYIFQSFHATPFIAGSVISVASLAAAFTRPIAGRAADNGFAKHTMLVGSLLGILGGLGHCYAANLNELFIARLLLGAGEAALFTGAISLVIHHCPVNKKGTLAGWFGLSLWLGLCVGPMLATFVHFIFGTTTAVWAIVTLFPVIGSLLILTTSTPHTIPQPKKLLALLPQGARLPGYAFLLASYGYGSINAMLILYLEFYHLGGVSMALPIFAMFFLITRILGSPLVDRFGARPVLLTFIAVEIIGLLMIFTSFLPIILMGIALTGAGVSMLYPAFVAVVVKQVPSTQHGAAIGFMTSFWDLGRVLAGPMGGAIAAMLGFHMVFLMASIFAMVSFLIVFGPLKDQSTAYLMQAEDKT